MQIYKIGQQCVCSTCRHDNLGYEQFAVLENSKIPAYICLKFSLISTKTVPTEELLPTTFVYSVLPQWMQNGLIIETEVVKEFLPFMDHLIRHGDYK
jgi:hypothetical protein